MLKGLNWLRALTIVGLLLAPAAPALAGGPPPDSPRAYPALLQMAREHPEQTVHVIVQRAGNARLPAQILERMGGRRARELPLVNAVALDLPASAVEALARDPAVREQSRAPYQRYQDFFAGLLRAGVAEGSLPAVDPELTAHVLVAFAAGLLLQSRADPQGADWAAVARAGLDLLLAGARRSV